MFAGCTSITSPRTRILPRPSSTSLRWYWMATSFSRIACARMLLAHGQEQHHPLVAGRAAHAVDAGHRGDDHDVAAGEQRRRRGVPQAVDVVVHRRVLLDVRVARREVRLGLVVVVVRDEVLDRVVREVLAELVAELGRQRLVVRDHQRRLLDPLDHPGHRVRLAGAGRAEQRGVVVVPVDRLGQLLDRPRLVARRLVVGGHMHLGHACSVPNRCSPDGRRGSARRAPPIPSPDGSERRRPHRPRRRGGLRARLRRPGRAGRAAEDRARRPSAGGRAAAGCWTSPAAAGWPARLRRMLGYTVTGVDESPAMLALARSGCPAPTCGWPLPTPSRRPPRTTTTP